MTRSYREGVRRLAEAQKSGAGVPAYLRWVNRGLGRRAAALAWVWGMTPNAVTAVSAASSAGAMLLIALLPLGVPVAAGACILLLVGYALDSADGQLARLTGRGSVAGEWLDHVVDAIRLPLLHIAIAAMFLRDHASPWLVASALGFSALASAWFFAQTLAEKLAPPGTADLADRSPAWVSFAKLPYDVGTLYLVVGIAWWRPGFAVVYVGLLVFTAGIAAISLRRKYRNLVLAASAPTPGRPQ